MRRNGYGLFLQTAERYGELKAAAPGFLLLMQVGSFMKVQDEWALLPA